MSFQPRVDSDLAYWRPIGALDDILLLLFSGFRACCLNTRLLFSTLSMMSLEIMLYAIVLPFRSVRVNDRHDRVGGLDLHIRIKGAIEEETRSCWKDLWPVEGVEEFYRSSLQELFRLSVLRWSSQNENNTMNNCSQPWRDHKLESLGHPTPKSNRWSRPQGFADLSLERLETFFAIGAINNFRITKLKSHCPTHGLQMGTLAFSSTKQLDRLVCHFGLNPWSQ
ncbi:hypothetical protein BJ875DRAFT_437074 [Amylocarpus encephaloides]|uniref:Uncharacterized protein n=1 Tax=Amylocarpus encephaloides TaxID=45428 RepID=A0A9P7YTF5_9HELO|nr:hypothetical protein BJ875DRAFT_437074 [Amylocarpus encephaloides]